MKHTAENDSAVCILQSLSKKDFCDRSRVTMHPLHIQSAKDILCLKPH